MKSYVGFNVFLLGEDVTHKVDSVAFISTAGLTDAFNSEVRWHVEMECKDGSASVHSVYDVKVVKSNKDLK